MHSPEHIKLQQLDWSNMRVISAVLGQSVALDFYARCLTERKKQVSVPLGDQFDGAHCCDQLDWLPVHFQPT